MIKNAIDFKNLESLNDEQRKELMNTALFFILDKNLKHPRHSIQLNL